MQPARRSNEGLLPQSPRKPERVQVNGAARLDCQFSFIFDLAGQQTPGYYTFQCLPLPAPGEPVFLLRQLKVINFFRNTFLGEYQAYGDGTRPAELVVDALRRRNLVDMRVAIETGGWFLPVGFHESLSAVLPHMDEATSIVELMQRERRSVTASGPTARSGSPSRRTGASEKSPASTTASTCRSDPACASTYPPRFAKTLNRQHHAHD